jgi:hypothetical protein
MYRLAIGCVGGGAILLGAAEAQAQTPSCQLGTVQVFITPANEGTCSIQQAGDGSYGVAIERAQTAYTQAVGVEVRGTTGQERFGTIVVNPQNPQPHTYSMTPLAIHGAQPADPISSVVKVFGNIPCQIDVLRTSGTLGSADFPNDSAIAVDRISIAVIGGDVIGDIYANAEDQDQGGVIVPPILQIFIGGHLK